MIRPGKIDTQLQAMAASADRANRPTGLVVIGGAVLTLAAIFALWSGFSFLKARNRLKDEMATREWVGVRLARIASKKQETPDLDAIYPPMPYFDTNIEDTALKVYEIAKEEKQAKLPVAVRPPDGPRPLTGTPGVGKTTVDVSLNAQPIEKILGLLNATQESPYLKTAFVSSINLTPIPAGWNAQIRFAAYVKAK